MEEQRKRGRPPAAVPSKRRSIVMPPVLYRRLEEIAQREERPVSELIVEAVRKLVKERESGNWVPELLEAA